MSKPRYVFLISAFLSLLNCTRKTESTSSFSLTFPSSQSSTAISAQGTGGTWNSSLNPNALADVNCYMVFIDSPMIPATTSCSNEAGTEIIKAGLMRGIYAAGATARIEVPASKDTGIMIVGLKSSTGACESIGAATPPTFSNYSYPFLLATEKKDLNPGDVEVTINLQANFNETARLKSCTASHLQPSVQPLLIFGQPGPRIVNNLRHGVGASTRGMFSSGGKTFISDCTTHRLFIYNSPPSSALAEPDLVLGAPSKDEAGAATVGAATMDCAYDVKYEGTKLLVADANHHRVLIWNTFPTVNAQPADVVLGQTTFLGSTNNSGGLSASSLYLPYALAVSGGKLFVADKGNNRVLAWNALPTTNNAPADQVLGQPNFTVNSANNGGISSSSLNLPVDVEVIGGNLFVADFNNNRVLKYSGLPVGNNASAAYVLGQPSFTSTSAACAANGLAQPTSIATAGSRFFISAANQNRILGFNAVPSSNGASADFALGQADLSTCSTPSSTNGSTFSAGSLGALGNTAAGGLTLADGARNRIMVWNNLSGGNQPAADWVYGQPNLTESIAFNPLSAGAVKMNGPSQAISDGQRMAVVDSGNHRVLIWNSISAAHGSPASIVVGQTDMNGYLANANSGPSSAVLSNPSAAMVHNERLYVVDTGNHRVLVFNTIPTADSPAAEFVLGQTAFNTATSGNSAGQFNSPMGIATDGTALAVADSLNHRVVIFTSLPGTTGASANVVLGQSGFYTPSSGCGPNKMSSPNGVLLLNGKILVADTGNNRVLIWNSLANVVNGQNADVVIGQNSFSACSSNESGLPNERRLRNPRAIAVDGSGRLYVADTGNNRILVFNSLPTANYAAADKVLGQVTFVTDDSNRNGLDELSLSKPSGIHIQDGNIWIADTGNHRVVRRPLPLQ